MRKNEIKHIMESIHINMRFYVIGEYREAILRNDTKNKEIRVINPSHGLDDKFEVKVRDYHIPRWKELPDFELYMDQILGFLEKHTEIFGTPDGEKIITNSMINNYVKLGLIKAPVKKKYDRNHVANIIMITILKKVLSMNEIKEAIFHCSNKMGEEAAYDLFCSELEASMLESLQEFSEEVPAFRVATKALSSKVMAEKIIQKNSKMHSNKKIIKE